MFTGNSEEFLALASLGNADAVLVGPFFDCCVVLERLDEWRGRYDLLESDQDSRSLSLRVAAASDAERDAEAAALDAFKLAIRELRRTLAINLSLDVGCGTGMPWTSSHSLRSI